MADKHRFFTLTDGRQFPIGATNSGQLVVKITPEEWDQLDQDQQEAIIAADIFLGREWMGGATYYQGRPETGPIWEV